MAFLNEVATWEPGVYQFEVTDLVQGGSDGVDNRPLKHLANRTSYLKAQADKMACGEVTVRNRGIISGCSLSKSGAVLRTLLLSSGIVFRWGREESCSGSTGIIVPENTSDDPVVLNVYLDDGGDLVVSASAVPEEGLLLATLTVPAHNTAETDPHLAACTLNSVARVEPAWPVFLLTPASESAEVVQEDPAVPYAVLADVVSWTGGEKPEVWCSRGVDSFSLDVYGLADDIVIRYLVRKM